MQFESLDLGEVNRAQSVDWFASGKVLNVAAALHRLGDSAHGFCPIGGPAGEEICREFHHKDVPATWLRIGQPTRVCTTLIVEPGPDAVVTELVGNAACLSDSELDLFRREFAELAKRADFVVLTGSMPPGTPATLMAELLEMVPESADAGRPVLLDLVGPELLECLPLRPRFVKPNRQELEFTFGESLASAEAIWHAMDRLHAAGALGVAVTDGPGPARLSYAPTHERLVVESAAIEPVNPIGSGDCFAAGFVYGYRRQGRLDEALRWAVGSAAANAERLLTADYDPARVAHLVGTLQAHHA
jgi:1-phosphofructokinase family hexose kinase